MLDRERLGAASNLIADVGVAGVLRLLSRLEEIEAADVVLMICTETYHRRVSGDEERGKAEQEQVRTKVATAQRKAEMERLFRVTPEDVTAIRSAEARSAAPAARS